MTCEERDRLQAEFRQSTLDYVDRIEKTQQTAAGSDLSSLTSAREEEGEALRIRGQAYNSLLQHRQNHGC